MTATTHREPPPILQPKRSRQSRQSRHRAFAAGLRDADRPWSIGIDVFALGGFVVLMCWETAEFAYTGIWEHLVAAAVVLVAGVVYAFRAFTTPDRSENHR